MTKTEFRSLHVKSLNLTSSQIVVTMAVISVLEMKKQRTKRWKSSSRAKNISIQDWSSGKPVPRTPLKATMQLDRGGFLKSSDSQQSKYLGDTLPGLHYHKTGINQITSTSINSHLSLCILGWRSSSWNEEQRFGGSRKGRGDTDALGLCQFKLTYTDKKTRRKWPKSALNSRFS